MKNSGTNHYIEVEGITLTENSIRELQSLQDENNKGINITVGLINTAIGWITSQLDMLNDADFDSAVQAMKKLALVSATIRELSKP